MMEALLRRVLAVWTALFVAGCAPTGVHTVKSVGDWSITCDMDAKGCWSTKRVIKPETGEAGPQLARINAAFYKETFRSDQLAVGFWLAPFPRDDRGAYMVLDGETPVRLRTQFCKSEGCSLQVDLTGKTRDAFLKAQTITLRMQVGQEETGPLEFEFSGASVSEALNEALTRERALGGRP